MLKTAAGKHIGGDAGAYGSGATWEGLWWVWWPVCMGGGGGRGVKKHVFLDLYFMTIDFVPKAGLGIVCESKHFHGSETDSVERERKRKKKKKKVHREKKLVVQF